MSKNKLYIVFWTKTAMNDVNDIIEYIVNDIIDSAIKIFDKIKKKGDKLNTLPHRGRIVPELNYHNILNLHEIVINPWRIIYEIKDRYVNILAVFDGRRNFNDVLLDRFLKH